MIETLTKMHEKVTIKLVSHGVVKWARALPTWKLVVITASCELMVVRVAIVHALQRRVVTLAIMIDKDEYLANYEICGFVSWEGVFIIHSLVPCEPNIKIIKNLKFYLSRFFKKWLNFPYFNLNSIKLAKLFVQISRVFPSIVTKHF